MIETIATGTPSTPFMKPGDVVRIEVTDDHGTSLFGRIEQVIR